MSRCTSAAVAKGGATLREYPRKGTRLNALCEMLLAHRGRPLKLYYKEWGAKSSCLGTLITSLRDFYGMDIRLLPGSTNGHRRGLICGTYVLAGEWHGRAYVDYIAQVITTGDSTP